MKVLNDKFGIPSDITSFEEYGTRWVAHLESGIQIFVQINKDKESPKWVRLGDLFEAYCLNQKGDTFHCCNDNIEEAMINVFKKIHAKD